MTIGILTALPCEANAVVSLLDEVGNFHDPQDQNHYWLGTVPSTDPARPHAVTVLMMSRDGTRSAAYYCANMLRTFPGIQVVIMAGIAGGMPRPRTPERHVRLGDIVVAADGIIDISHVRRERGRAEPRGRQAAGLISQRLLRAARELQLEDLRDVRRWAHYLNPERSPLAVRPPADTDVLYVRDIRVPHPDRPGGPSLDGLPRVHHGVIGSGDVLMRDEDARDELAERFPDMLAIEMEGSGIAASTAAEDRAWFMVRGVADYAEASGKNDLWHPFASYAAACYVRALLERTPALAGQAMRLGGRALPVLAAAEQVELEALLQRIPSGVDVQAVWQAAVPELPRPSPEMLATPAAAIEYLTGLNADAAGLHPAVVFVGRLGQALVADPVGAELLAWAEARAAAARAGAALQDRLGVPGERPPGPGPVLLVDIMADGIDRESCRIVPYLQDGDRSLPRPVPGGPADVPVSGLEDAARELVAEAERMWTRSDEPASIEFVMPLRLLNLPVQWFSGPRLFDRADPLCLEYTVTVRSRERMHETRVRRSWGNRWRQIDAKPFTGRVLWGAGRGDDQTLETWAGRLRADDRYAVVVLSEPPDSPWGRRELHAALVAGVPVILWDQRLSRPPDGTHGLDRLIAEPPELPGNTRRVRIEAHLAAATQPEHFGRWVALLWDDPRRLLTGPGAES
ncbi:MAG TPA: hypothetical protein VFW27_32440 [Actinoplanes sp.]|nr:hypothetical protein [Actinoplanes sp.]